MMNEKDLIYDVIMTVHNNKEKSYKRIVNIILSKYQQEFRNRNFMLDLSDIPITNITQGFFKYNPFQFSFDKRDIKTRQLLYDETEKILTPSDNELISIGTGYIGKEC